MTPVGSGCERSPMPPPWRSPNARAFEQVEVSPPGTRNGARLSSPGGPGDGICSARSWGAAHALKRVLRQVEMVATDRCQRSDPGRDRQREGADCARDPPTESARSQATGEGELRVDSRANSLRANSSDTPADRSPEPSATAWAGFSWPTAARCFSTKWARSRSSLQSKLLRVLQEGEFERVGDETHAAGERARRCGDQP